MAYIITSVTKKGYCADLWQDPDDPDTAFEFHEVKTEIALVPLIIKLKKQGHILCRDDDPDD